MRERSGCELSVWKRVESNLLQWFGHIERMEEEILVRKVYRETVDGNRRRGRPKRRWEDEVRVNDSE